jgi:hypothetical protein
VNDGLAACKRYYERAPAEACAYVRETAAAIVRERAPDNGIYAAELARAAFLCACELASYFWEARR